MHAPWKKSYNKPKQHIKKHRHHFANKGPSSQSYGFSISHVYMWELGHKEGWVPKNWCFQTVVLEKTLESNLDSKEISKVNQRWIFIGRTDAEAALATSCQELTHWKRAWYWERLRERGEGDDRGWGVWMVSLTQWTSVWANLER